MRVYKRQRGTGFPVAEHRVLDVFRLEWLAEQGIALQIDHAEREVIASAPESMRRPRFIVAQRCAGDRRTSHAKAAELVHRRLTRDHKTSGTKLGGLTGK